MAEDTTVEMTDGSVYVGQWLLHDTSVAGLSGHGTIHAENSSDDVKVIHYTGQWSAGRKEGRGRSKHRDGNIYEVD